MMGIRSLFSISIGGIPKDHSMLAKFFATKRKGCMTAIWPALIGTFSNKMAGLRSHGSVTQHGILKHTFIIMDITQFGELLSSVEMLYLILVILFSQIFRWI